MNFVPPTCCQELFDAHGDTFVIGSKFLIYGLEVLLVGSDGVENMCLLNFLVWAVGLCNVVKNFLFIFKTQLGESEDFSGNAPFSADIELVGCQAVVVSLEPLLKTGNLLWWVGKVNELILKYIFSLFWEWLLRGEFWEYVFEDEGEQISSFLNRNILVDRYS